MKQKFKKEDKEVTINLSPKFDLTVIDEGSQLKVSDAMLLLPLMARNGRLVVAGIEFDHSS